MKWRTEKRKISDLIPAEYNPRQLTEKQAKDLGDSLTKFDLADPIVINTDNTIIGGHQRINILKTKGDLEVDVRVPDTKLTEQEERELNIRLNKNLGEWDFDKLAEFDIDLLKDTGFTFEELDKIFQIEPEDKDDEVPEVPEEPKSKLGDIYILGNHRVMCGDSTNVNDVEKLMDGKKADMVFTDPPYNVNYSGRGKNTSNKIKNDNMDLSSFATFLSDVFVNYKMFSKVGSAIYVCHADGKPMIRATFEIEFNKSFRQSATIIWVKNMASMGWQHYRSQHEPILYGWNGEKAPFYGDRTKTTIWKVSREQNYKHPTQKPIELVSMAISNSAKHEDIVLDLFLGSGSTLIACEKTNRICYGMELDPKYVDVIVKRWEDYTGLKSQKIKENVQ